MTKAMHVQSVSMVVFLFAGLFNANAVETRKTDLAITQNIEKLTALFQQLSGDVTELKAKLRIVAEEGTRNPKVIELASALAKLISKQSRPDQQQALLLELVEISCRNMRDGCELRRRLDDLDFRIRELERQRLQPLEPTPAEPSPAPPSSTPSLLPRWDGHIDYILDRSARLGSATIVRKCVNYRFADGDIYHGDIYRDAYGWFALVKHRPSPPGSYSVARQPVQ